MDHSLIAKTSARKKQGSNDEERVANARLIAAAPDLLEALDCLMQETVDADFAFGNGITDGVEKAYHKAVAAIAKAA